MNSSLTLVVTIKPGITTGRVVRLLHRAPFITQVDVLNVITPDTLLDRGGHVNVLDPRLCRKCDNHHPVTAPCVTT